MKQKVKNGLLGLFITFIILYSALSFGYLTIDFTEFSLASRVLMLVASASIAFVSFGITEED